MLILLRKRYTEKAGNGDAWAFIPHVRDAAGHNSSRTADAIAMALWPSRGLVLHGFEIKTSRSDWLRELKNPAKAEVFATLVDYWWLAVADANVVAAGELPEGWGLLVAKGGRLVCLQDAAPLHPGVRVPGAKPLPESFGRSFLAALLRGAVNNHLAPEEVQAKIDYALARHKLEMEHRQETIATLRGRLDKFKETFGVALGDEDDVWRYGGRPASEVGAALRLVLDGDADLERHHEQLRHLLQAAERLAKDLRKSLAGVDGEAATV